MRFLRIWFGVTRIFSWLPLSTGDRLSKPDFVAKFVQISTLLRIRVFLSIFMLNFISDTFQASLESIRVHGTLGFTWFIVS